MMKRKVALLMTTVMLATSVLPAGITAYAEDAVVTGETAVEATLDETSEESVDASALNGDVNVPDEDAAQAEETTQAADDELQPDEFVAEEIAADEAMQDAPAENGEQDAPIMADGGLVISDVEVVDEASPVNVNDNEQDGTTEETAILITQNKVNTMIEAPAGDITGNIYYSFTPEEAGNYTLVSFTDESVDPDIAFNDTEKDLWNGDDDDFRMNFKWSRYFQKGEKSSFSIHTCEEDRNFNFGIYKTSDLVLTNIALSAGSAAPAFVYGIDDFSSYLKKLEEQETSFDFSYKTGESTSGTRLLDLREGESIRYFDKYYNEIKFSVDGVPVSNELDPYAYNVGEHKLTIVEGSAEKGVPFTIGNINDANIASEVGLTEIAKDVSIIAIPDTGIAYYKYTAPKNGEYVFRRSSGEGIYAVLNSAIESSDEYTWDFNHLQAITMDMNAEDICYIAVPDAQGGKLTIGEPKEIKSVEFTEKDQYVVQQASEVIEKGLAYKIKITYTDDSNEVIDGQDYQGQSTLQSITGAYLSVSYSVDGAYINMENFENMVPIGTMKLVVRQSQKEIAQEIEIQNDFDVKAETLDLADGSADYTVAEGDTFIKIEGAGEYIVSTDIWKELPCYYLSDGFMYQGSDYYSENNLWIEDIVYMDVSDMPAGSRMQVRKLRAVKSVSVQPGSIQLVEGKYTVKKDEYDEYKVYMDYDSVKLRIEYEDGIEEVPLSKDVTQDGRHISWGWYKGDQDVYYDFYDEVIPAGSYVIHIWVNGLDPVLLPVTVVHDWGAWTTSKKADINSPETQTSKCAHCGTVGTRTIGSKLAPVLTLTDNKLTMKTKQSTSKFKVEAMAAGDTLATVTSSNTKLLKVSNVNPNGTFKLKTQGKTGTAKLTITLKSGLSKTIKVKIQAAKVKTTKIKVASKKLTLSKKQKYNLAAVVMPVTSYDKVKYTTSNKKVATVNKKGQITAKGKGKATITVKSGKKSVKVKVTVK